jgi:hypothetical protein
MATAGLVPFLGLFLILLGRYRYITLAVKIIPILLARSVLGVR